MRLLLTGLNGTLAPKASARAAQRGWRVESWDRRLVPPADAPACRAYLAKVKPEAIIHMAMGDEAWAGLLAAYAAAQGVPFVFTSSAMVFDNVPDGPHAPCDARTARNTAGPPMSKAPLISSMPAVDETESGFMVVKKNATTPMVASSAPHHVVARRSP